VNARPGSWVAAVVPLPEVGNVTAVAIYGLMDERSDASVHRSLSDLTPLFEDSRYNELIVLGGDLNSWTGWPAGTRQLARDESVFQRIAAFGFVDCLAIAPGRDALGRLQDCPCSYGDDCRHTRTRRDPRMPDRPYQMDYLFASRPLEHRLTVCEVIDLGPGAPSDHLPIRATFTR
jgi:endonuclease/exonuclease/phosphatase family metal-dependent hydrolase